MRCSKCEKELHECKCVWAIPIVCQRCGEVNPAEIHTCTPKRGWVSLTNEEINQIYTYAMSDMDFILDAQAKLKEKNS